MIVSHKGHFILNWKLDTLWTLSFLCTIGNKFTRLNSVIHVSPRIYSASKCKHWEIKFIDLQPSENWVEWNPFRSRNFKTAKLNLSYLAQTSLQIIRSEMISSFMYVLCTSLTVGFTVDLNIRTQWLGACKPSWISRLVLKTPLQYIGIH